MSQQNLAQPKYKIVFAPGGGASNQAKRGRARALPRNNDVEQAVKSITYASNPPAVKTVRKGGMVFNNSVNSEKPDKLLFLPKYVQKKVTVIRDSPKPSVNTLLSGKPSLPGSSGTPILKKKKVLGDMALQTWGTPKIIKTEDEVTSESPTLLCRVCGSLIEDTIINLIDDNGTLTRIGSKLATIVGSDLNENPLYPPACCKPCSFKINVCFPLLLELQASDAVVRETYADLQEGDLINPTAHIYTCNDCEQEVVGMKDYISHYESHLQNKFLGELNDKLTVKPSAEEPEDNIAELAQMYLDEDVDDGSVIYQNEAGELICEKCGRTFKYKFLLQLHRKAPKRGHSRDSSPPSKVCFVCKQSRVSTVSCKLGDSTIPLCQPCRANVSFMVV